MIRFAGGSSAMHWSFVTTRFPWPLTHGSYLRVYHLARALRGMGDKVTVLSPAGSEEEIRRYEALGVRVVSAPPRDDASGLERRPLSPYVYQPGLGRQLANEAGLFGTNVVLVGAGSLQYAGEARRAGDVVVADLIDDPLLEERRKLWRQPHPPVLMRRLRFLMGQRRYERAYVPLVDLVTVVSVEDARGFQRRHPESRVTTISNGVDVEYFRPAEGRREDDGRTLVFLGNLGHAPNVDAAWYLVNDVMPRIRQRAGELRPRLVIVGPNAPDKLYRLRQADVQVVGGVSDVRPHLWQSAAMVVPMRIGTGVKNKLLEGWAAGVPVVATPLSCQGVDARDGENVLIGSTAGGLADQVVQLLRKVSLRRRLSVAGLEEASRRSWTVVAGLFQQSVEGIRFRKMSKATSTKG